ncbi:protein phosphatase 1 regulatory subunit 16A [Xenopus laevis]|uniref:protein phosphatase 1 regulatory subunit 16A n=1 Tax=Xenopus laevis TaxID=8355 RepID=A0A8J0T774_XENLA|nr:protein phosphatase 1 regulatory subunit 16A [Xenopus laevis]XP_041424240.1 protein phosphatase 1 regulatory subunit 16A [Xenopus laevis]
MKRSSRTMIKRVTHRCTNRVWRRSQRKPPELRERRGQGRSMRCQRNGSLIPTSNHTNHLDCSVPYQLATQEDTGPDLSSECSHHPLAKLKRQCAAAKLQRHAPSPVTDREAQDFSGPAHQEPVYYTTASGEPPLLKLIAPAEETTPVQKRPFCGVM